jgi:hypothetical protein
VLHDDAYREASARVRASIASLPPVDAAVELLGELVEARVSREIGSD